jgi:hypothetical protein
VTPFPKNSRSVGNPKFRKHSMLSEFRCPFVSFIKFIARRPFAPESTHFHPVEARKCWNRVMRSAVGLGLDNWRLGFKKPSFTILTGLAAHRTRTSSSLAAFVACSFPPHLSAQGRPRDLRDFSTIPAEIRLYCAPLHGALHDPSSQYNPSERDRSPL